jgi:hypothetical protein
VRALVNCKVRELARTLQLLLVTICKWPINPITNPNPVYMQNLTRDNILSVSESMAPGTIFESNREEITGGWSTL